MFVCQLALFATALQ